MLRFLALLRQLEQIQSAEEAVVLLQEYFQPLSVDDKVWALYLLWGKSLPTSISAVRLKRYALNQANIAEWLWKECQAITGDVCETVALLCARTDKTIPSEWIEDSLSAWLTVWILAQSGKNAEQQQAFLQQLWHTFDVQDAWYVLRLVSGGLKTTMYQAWVIRFLVEHLQGNLLECWRQLTSNWQPQLDFWFQFLEAISSINYQPYPFTPIIE
ncbi:MAG: hypothetical protein NZ108_08260, partial [Bacteroidia bacterium]|nr:hypothetical protein [Bacteroidia bacterium]